MLHIDKWLITKSIESSKKNKNIVIWSEYNIFFLFWKKKWRNECTSGAIGTYSQLSLIKVYIYICKYFIYVYPSTRIIIRSLSIFPTIYNFKTRPFSKKDNFLLFFLASNRERIILWVWNKQKKWCETMFI